MQHQLASFFRKRVPEYTHQKYVLAVSGGVDSMVLLNVMALLFEDDAKNHILVSHVNYGHRAKSKEE